MELETRVSSDALPVGGQKGPGRRISYLEGTAHRFQTRTIVHVCPPVEYCDLCGPFLKRPCGTSLPRDTILKARSELDIGSAMFYNCRPMVCITRAPLGRPRDAGSNPACSHLRLQMVLRKLVPRQKLRLRLQTYSSWHLWTLAFLQLLE